MINIKNFNPEMLRKALRKSAREAEIKENEKHGHRDDAGLSPFSVESPTTKTVFEPNDR